MTDNERLCKALGKHPDPMESSYGHCADYEGDDAAAVALLEELSYRVAGLTLGCGTGLYQLWDGADRPVGHAATTFRAAVVAGALALLCGDE